MAKWARIQDGRCVEFIDFDPVGNFHPDIVWVQVPANMERWADYSFVHDVENSTVRPESLLSMQDRVKNVLAHRRWLHEVGGLVVGGQLVRTDRESQALISGAYSSLKNGLIASVRFKTANGFTDFDLASFEPLAQAVANFVQQCFSAEANHCELIDATTDQDFDTLFGYDIEAGWPANGKV